MSQHNSLRVESVGKKHRNVLKRFERIRKMQETGKWQDRGTVYGLPKMKSMKIKVRKAKAEKTDAAAETKPQAATGTAVPPAVPAKDQGKAAKPAKPAK